MAFAIHQGFFVAQLVENLPARWETWVQSLGWEDPLEKEKATHSSILVWRNHGRQAWQATVHGLQRVERDWVTFTFISFSTWLVFSGRSKRFFKTPFKSLYQILSLNLAIFFFPWSKVGLRKHLLWTKLGGDGIPGDLFQILKDGAV